jgi:hypothetical protein
MARLEEMDAEAWFRGERTEALPILDEAAAIFATTRQKFLDASAHCARYRGWFPADRRNELTPDLETFHRMAYLLEEIVEALTAHELPTLEQMHQADEMMRTEMIVGERKALAHRGTRGHFPIDSI